MRSGEEDLGRSSSWEVEKARGHWEQRGASGGQGRGAEGRVRISTPPMDASVSVTRHLTLRSGSLFNDKHITVPPEPLSLGRGWLCRPHPGPPFTGGFSQESAFCCHVPGCGRVQAVGWAAALAGPRVSGSRSKLGPGPELDTPTVSSCRKAMLGRTRALAGLENKQERWPLLCLQQACSVRAASCSGGDCVSSVPPSLRDTLWSWFANAWSRVVWS